MNNRKVGLGDITMIALISAIIGIGITPTLLQQQSAYAIGIISELGGTKKAPIATSGDNVYIAWWTNKTGNDEVMFRASTDSGKTLGEKMNLSNSTNAESQDVSIDASGDSVFVTWWERNATINQPVLRISNDDGKTFGPLLNLSANDTIGSSSGG